MTFHPRLSKDEYFLKMLDLVASRSTCIRRAVGAIIVDKDGHVLSTGYNGVPRDFDHCTDVPCRGARDHSGDNSNCMAVHAEQNAILQCLNIQLAHTIYCSCVPCFHCAKIIANTNIETVIALSVYTDTRGFDVLRERGCIIRIMNSQGEVTSGEEAAG